MFGEIADAVVSAAIVGLAAASAAVATAPAIPLLIITPSLTWLLCCATRRPVTLFCAFVVPAAADAAVLSTAVPINAFAVVDADVAAAVVAAAAHSSHAEMWLLVLTRPVEPAVAANFQARQHGSSGACVVFEVGAAGGM